MRYLILHKQKIYFEQTTEETVNKLIKDKSFREEWLADKRAVSEGRGKRFKTYSTITVVRV